MARSSKVARICVGAAALCLSFACLGCQSSATIDPEVEAMVESAVTNAGVSTKDVAAVVGGRIVSQQQVEDALMFQRIHGNLEDDDAWELYLASAGVTEDEIRNATIKNLIDAELVAFEADRLGIVLNDQEVDSRIASLESRYPSHASFLEALRKNGYTEEGYRGAVRQSLLWSALQSAQVPPPSPTEEQVRQYAVVVAPTLVGRRSSHILLSGSDYTKAQEVHRLLEEGADFTELVQTYSIDTTSVDGDQGWDSLTVFVEPYQTALDQLQPGEFSDVVRTRFGYHIILCTDIYEAPLGPDGSIDIAAIPDDLMSSIVDLMSRSLAMQMADDYMRYLEATIPIAVFDADGNQIYPGDVGLATQATPPASTDSAVEKIQGDIEDGVSVVIDDEGDPAVDVLP